MPDFHGNALPKGYLVEGYRIESVLGAGGFGITYKALEVKLDRHVAVKEYMPRDLAMRESDGHSVRPISEEDRTVFDYGLTRFEDEGKTLVQFRHPNIVPVLKFFDANGTAYLVMEYVEGRSLQDILNRDKTLPESEIREILVPILDGLETVHQASYLHRDIKPDNIFIRAADGSPVLLDFGAARQALGTKSRTLTSIVTPGYAPFEQYSAKGKQGPWTDIYGIGATLYRAVTEARPPDAAERILEDEYIPAANACKGQYSALFLDAIDAALALQPQERPQSIAAWRSVLNEGAPAAAQAEAKPTASPRPGNKTILKASPARKSRAKLALPLAIAAVVVVGGVFAYNQMSSSGQEGIPVAKGRPAASEAPKPAQPVVKPAEVARRKAAEEARQKAAAEETRREAAAAKRKAAEEARRKAAEEARQKAAAEKSKTAEEARRKAAEAAQRQATAEKSKMAEEAKRKAAAAKRKAVEEARRKTAETARRKAREAARKKAAAARQAKAAAARKAKAVAVRKTKAAAARKAKAAGGGTQQATAGGATQLTAAIAGRSARFSRPDPPLEAQFVINFRAGGAVTGTRHRIDEEGDIFDQAAITGRWSIEGGRLCTRINLDKNTKICGTLVKRGNKYRAAGGGILGSFTLVK